MKAGKGRFHEHFPQIRFVSRKAIFVLFRLFSSNCQQVYKTIRSNPGQHPVNFVRRARLHLVFFRDAAKAAFRVRVTRIHLRSNRESGGYGGAVQTQASRLSIVA